MQRREPMARVLLLLLASAALAGCTDPAAPSPSYGMPTRDGPPDLSEVTADFRTWGGAAMILLTAQPSDSVLSDLQALGVHHISDPGFNNFHWIYGGIPGEDVTAVVAGRPYVTGVTPLHDPPYGPVPGPAPVGVDSALLPELELRASLDRVHVAPGESVELTVWLRNPADTAAVITYGHSCDFVLGPARVLADGGAVSIPVDGADYGCHDTIWSDTIEAGASQERVRTVTAAIQGIPIPQGTYRLRVWRNAIPELPDVTVSFEVVGSPE